MEKESALSSENIEKQETVKTMDNTNNKKLKILVFGVGVIGSLMVHYLCEAGNDVTVCARHTYDELKEKGLVIRHYVQRKTTVDHPNVVKEVDTSEKYDIVFSVMQGQQQLALLDVLCKVNSNLIVLVGNNMESKKCDDYINEHKVSERRILYGFQASAGHREGALTVAASMLTVPLYIGGLRNPGHPEDLSLVKKAFTVKGYKIIELEDMYAFYIYHVAEVMPLAYLSYKYDCDLKKATSEDIKMALGSTKEAIEILKENNIEPIPKGEDAFFDGFKGKLFYGFLRFICKNRIGKLTISDHCYNAVEEMKYLDKMFDQYRTEHSKKEMPTWDATRKWAESAFQ